MPAQDRTGPQGQGPLTGRGLGLCGRGSRQGFGRGFGFNRGFGFRQRPVEPEITEKQEKEYLEEELKILKQDKDEMEKRLKELEKI